MRCLPKIQISSYSSFYATSRKIVGLNFLHNTYFECGIKHPNDLTRLTIEYRAELLKKGFIYDSHKINESDLLAAFLARIATAAAKRRFHFALIPTTECNSRCSYCYECHTHDSPPSFWKPSMITAALDSIKKIVATHSAESISFDILGGEVFQSGFRNSLALLLQGLRSLNLRKNVHVITNGVELPECSDLLFNFKDVVGSIQITLDGPAAVHDAMRPSIFARSSYETIMSCLPKLLKEFTVHLRLHIQDGAVQYLPLLFEDVIKMKKQYADKLVPYVYPITIKGNFAAQTRHHSDVRQKEAHLLGQCLKLFELIPENSDLSLIGIDFPSSSHLWSLISGRHFKFRQYFCSANADQYVFGPDGNIYKCWWSIGNREHQIGSFESNDAEHGIDSRADAFWRNRTLPNIDRCRGCKYALICAGGCSFKAWLAHGSIYEPLCPNLDAISQMLIKFKEKGDVTTLTPFEN